MSDPALQQPPVLEYGDPQVAGPEAFDRFMGTVLYVLAGICAAGAAIVAGVILIRGHWTPIILICGGVGILLLMGMSVSLLSAGRMILSVQRRQR